jgi:hypothetical protein
VKTKTSIFFDQTMIQVQIMIMVVVVTSVLAWSPGLLRADGDYSVRLGVNYSSGYGYHSGHHKSYQRRVHHGYNAYGYSGFNNGFHGGHKGYGYKSNFGQGYGQGYRNNRSGHRTGYHHSGNHNYYSSGDLAAAAIIGGIIGYGVSYYQNRQRYYEPYHTARGYAYKVYPASVTTVETRQQIIVSPPKKLLKELDGRCYEIIQNKFGDELKVQLESWNCNW